MTLTTQQVAEKLHVTKGAVVKLVQAGTLMPTNERKPGAAKFFMRFDDKAVRAYAKANGTGKAPKGRVVVLRPTAGATGILSRLDSIESKLDQLLRLWS